MKKIIDDVKRNTPKSIAGYYYLKTQKIYIPFMKISIRCLTRRISDLNLFFESILKLIDISVNDINEIANILGVSRSVVNEAVIDMVGIDYVFVSENQLVITEKGAKALSTKKQVDLRDTHLKDIMVDMITGAIYDADSIKVTETRQRDILLEGVVKIGDNFIESHFREINDVYQLRQKNNSVFGDSAITDELYKAIEITYSELHYVENRVHMYKSESSDELLFVFSSDNNDKYKNEFYNQLKDSCRPCQEYFFENNRDIVRKISSKSTTQINLIEQTENTRKILFDDNATEEDKENVFRQRRYSLCDNEYLNYLYNSNSLRYSKVLICSDHMSSLLSHAFCSQLNILAEKIPVFIIYHKYERGIERSLQYFFKNPSENLHLIASEDIVENLICFDSELVMYLYENVVTAFDRPVMYMQPVCDFDKKNAAETIEKLISKYNLSSLISKKRAQNKSQRGRKKGKK